MESPTGDKIESDLEGSAEARDAGKCMKLFLVLNHIIKISVDKCELSQVI